MWDKRVLEKMGAMVGTFLVLVKWQGVVAGFIWACSVVYGPNDNNERGHMWDELVVFSNTRGYRGIVLGILISYGFQVNIWVGHV